MAIGIVGVCGRALLWFAISQNGTGNASWIAPFPRPREWVRSFPQFLIGFGAPGGAPLYAGSSR